MPDCRNIDHLAHIPDGNGAEARAFRVHHVFGIDQNAHPQQHKGKELVAQIRDLSGSGDKSPFKAKITYKIGEGQPGRVIPTSA